MIDTKNPSVELNAFDRCDRCGAQAYALARRDGFELTFCMHHAKQHNLALELDGWIISWDYIGIDSLIEPEKVSV